MAGIDLSRLNDSQREVVTRLDEPLFVAAGAGSGKTFTLTARLVHALSHGSAADGGRYLSSIDEALVITFTKAAALEIKDRVRAALRAAGEGDPHLREESLRVDDAWISTIHGMCARMLRRHALELGIDPAFTVCEESVADALYARALDEALSDVQRDDAHAALRDEFALWGAGSQGGGTVAGMIRQLCDEAATCPRGFDDLRSPASREAAAETMRVLSCFEALAALTLTERQRAVVEASLASLAAFASLAPGERTAERACAALAQVRVPALRKADQVPLKEDARLALAQALVCAEYERVQGLAPQLVGLARRVHERYGQLKRERSCLDNDDLVTCALAAVESIPEVAREYAGRFRLVMIDEFQDTDEKQLRLVSLLSGEGARHLATVGDAQQSIYRFRGGDVEVFRARGGGMPAAARVEMDVNYRSDPHVLALVERVCGDAGVLDDFLRLAGDGGREGSYAAREPEGAEPPRIRLEVAEGATAELTSATIAAQLADRLASYHRMGQPAGSMALLLGTTGRVGLYLDALRARGLPAVVTGGSSFSTTAEVGVVQALLHTLANPHDTEAGLFRLLSSDMFRLDADDFCQLGTRAQELLDAPTKRPVEQCFVDDELELYGDARPSARLLAAHGVLRRAFARMGRWELADVCQVAMEESGWLSRLERRGPDGLAVAANVLAAVRYVRELTGSLGLGVARAASEFDQWLAAARLTPKNLVGDAIDAVQVMTIHGAKGLQFAVTAVAECWGRPALSGRLSVGRQGASRMVCVAPRPADARAFAKMRQEIEVPADATCCGTVAEWAALLDEQELAAQAGERARLLYVALTRAEEALVVGLPVAEREHLRSPLALGVLGAFPELDELVAGECDVSIEPECGIACERRVSDAAGAGRIVRERVAVRPGVARVVSLRRGTTRDDPWEASSAGTLAGFDGPLPEAVSQVPMLGTEGGAGAGRDRAPEPFMLFDTVRREMLTRGYRAREGVFSYSSAHALMSQAAVRPEMAPGRTAQQGMAVSSPQAPRRLPSQGSDPGMTPAQATPGRTVRTLPPTPPRAQQEAEAEGSAYTDDADKATSLGSAFHELAQTMVETGRDHSPQRLEALARTWRLSRRQVERLGEAIVRWEGCSLRAEVLSHELVRAEVPFFARADSTHGRYVEGAIDLLACDRDGTRALVVDYKTGDVGLSPEQVEERHRMQANLYAWVLMGQGFEAVECAFVCVEVDDGTGGPVVVRYRFDGTRPAHIG
ncbi:MAG: UvrD-helicase domain-containing protein [Acidobacteriota bacterium]|nr:UvrD-helicase domain-containing protein [Acidobacteriota bacterium]